MLPYLYFGYAGHDIELHVTSWMEVAESWRAGLLYPGWSTRANFMLGDPHFCFYPPLSFVLGGVLALLLPVHLVPAAFMVVAAALAGLAMYTAAAPFVAERDRLPAALLYMLSPYFITTSLVRFAAAELLVQSIIPLVLLAFWRGVWQGERRAVAVLGGLLALAWLTNIPAAIVLFYGLLPAAAYCAWQRRSLAPALSFFVAELCAVCLAAFHLVPVLLEKSWISQGVLVRQDPRVLLIFFAPHAPSLHPMRTFVFGLWLIAAASALLTAACLLRRLPSRTSSGVSLFLIIAATAFLLQTALAAPLWTYLPQLISAAFPYRFLPLESVPLILILLSPQTNRRWRAPGFVGLGLLTLMAFAEFAIVQSKPDTRMPSFAATLTRWNSDGYEGFPEFVPARATVKHTAADTAATGSCVTKASPPLSVRPYAQVNSFTGCRVRFGVLAYPYWSATLDGVETLPIERSADGRAEAVVPGGMHTVQLDFAAKSPARTVALVLSAFSALLLAAFWRRERRRA